MRRLLCFMLSLNSRRALVILAVVAGCCGVAPVGAEVQQGFLKNKGIHTQLYPPIEASLRLPSESNSSIATGGLSENIGVVAKLGFREETDARQIALLKALGVTEIIWTPGEWANNETSQGKYALQPAVLKALAAIKANGMRSVIVLFRKNPIYSNPLDDAAFARYCGWMAKTLSNQPVAAFQIWNEPSNFDVRDYYGGAWNARGDAPWLQQFVRLMADAANAIRAVQADATIIVSLEGPPLLRALDNYPSAFDQINGISLHPYPGKLPPERVPWGGIGIELRDGVSVADAGGSLTSTLRIQTLDAPEKTLHRPLEAWITEYGYPTCSPQSPQQHFLCVSPVEQAAYVTRGLILGLTQKVTLWSLYELADEGVSSTDAEQNFGLVKSEAEGFAVKPAYYAVQRVCRLLGTHWRHVSRLPDDLMARLDGGQAWAISQSSTAGPQLSWFHVADGYVGFLWKAGDYQTGGKQEHILLNVSSFEPSRIQLIDLVSRAGIRTVGAKRAGLLSLPITSDPVAIHLTELNSETNRQ